MSGAHFLQLGRPTSIKNMPPTHNLRNRNNNISRYFYVSIAGSPNQREGNYCYTIYFVTLGWRSYSSYLCPPFVNGIVKLMFPYQYFMGLSYDLIHDDCGMTASTLTWPYAWRESGLPDIPPLVNWHSRWSHRMEETLFLLWSYISWLVWERQWSWIT